MEEKRKYWKGRSMDRLKSFQKQSKDCLKDISDFLTNVQIYDEQVKQSMEILEQAVINLAVAINSAPQKEEEKK
jgi:hypothetical protein